MTYTLYNYFDVWGNEIDGYEVNNWDILFDDWYITDDATKQDILDYLYDNGYLTTNDLSQVDISEDGLAMEVYSVKDDMPLFGIVPNM